MQKLYNEMWLAFQRGEISQETWFKFANEVFDQLLSEFEDTLVRLKNI